MGYTRFEGHFSASLSRHNSSKDERHDALWLDFVTKVEALVKNKKYDEINLEVTAMVVD
jgi:hypothetical protein